MKLSAFQKIRRRDLIKSLGGAALLLPHLELFERAARAQSTTKKSKYIVFCYTPDGVNQDVFWPTGSESSFTLSKTLSPFEPYKDKILLVGPQMNGNTRKQGTGLAYISRPPQHQAPVTLAARIGKGCNTGDFSSECLNGTGGLPYVDQSRAVNKLDGPSIDQVIAKAVKGDSVLGSVNLGLHPIGGDTPSDINFDDSGAALQRKSTADDAWRYVFGDTSGATTPTTTVSPLNKYNAVSNFLHGRFTALRPTLSSGDRKRLDAHLSSLTDYEAVVKGRLGSGMTTMPPSSECTNPTRAMVKTDADSIRTGADSQTLSPFFMDIIATAFHCNLTKVATVTFGYPGGGDAGGLRMPWLGFTDPMHFVSHHAGDSTKLDRYQKMNQWVAGEIAGLMQRLAARPSATGTGTLLDETTIYWFNRHGDGNAHDNFGLPNIILGGTGGYFKMGRWLQLPATNPTKVLISLANAMGVQVTSFGEPAFMDTSPLSALTG